MVAPGLLAQGLPGFHRHVAVGLGRQLQDHLAGVDVGHDLRHALRHAFGQRLAVELAELLDLGAGLPADALAAVAQLVHQGAQGGEALVDVRVVALDDRDLRRRLARDQLALALLPLLDVEGLRQLGRAVVHQRRQHHFLLDTQVTDADLAEGLGETLVDLPVALALPHRVHGRRQRVDEGVHVAGIEVVLLVPAGGGQHDVAVQARGAHAEIERHDEIQLAFGRLLVPLHLAGLGIVTTEVLALHTALGAEQVLAEIFVTLAAAAQQVAAPDEQVARPVLWRVGVLAAHLQRAVLERAHDIVLGIHARRGGVLHHLHRVGLELRCRRQPAHALGAHVVVDHAAAVELPVGVAQGRRGDLLHAQLLVAPLVGVGVEEAGAVHLPRRADPVQREGQRRPAGLRAQLLLAHVMRPAAAALADAAAHHQQVDDAAVVHVGVVPVVHRRADDDHALAVRLVGVVGELPRHGDDLVARHAGDALGPGRRVGSVVVVALGTAAQAAVDAVLRGLQVEHGGDERVALLAFLAQAQPHRRHLDAVHAALLGIRLEMRRGDAAEIGQADIDHLVLLLAVFQHRQLELDLGAVAGLLGFEVPLAEVGALFRAPAEADRAVGQHGAAVAVEGHRLPLGVVVLAELAVEVAGAHVAVGHQRLAAVGQREFLQHHQQRQVGIAARIVIEIRAALLEVKLVQRHVAHGHGQRGVGALLGVQPQVGELGDFGIVRRHRHRLGTLVAHLGEEVRVGRARLRHVAAPGDDVGAVVPVGALRHVGLLAPDLRAGRRQVAVPVVEAHAHAADQAQVAAAGGIADHAHRRNRRKAHDTVGAMFFDGVDVGRGDELVHLVPAAAHEAAHATHLLVVASGRGVLDDHAPGIHRRLAHLQRRAPALQQAAAHHRVLDAVGAVQVPGIRGTAGAAARLVVGHVPACARVVGLLRLPGDDAALDVDLPAAAAGAVHAVRAAHDLVVRPAVAVGVLPGAVFTGGHAVVAGEAFLGQAEVGEAVEEVAHCVLSVRLR